MTAAGVLIAWICLSAPAWGAEILSLEECLRIAEENHPSLAGAAAQIATERGRLSQAAVPDRLEVSGSASGVRNSSRGEENASYSVGASSSLKVFDANRTRYAVDAQRDTLSATEKEGQNTFLQVRSNVKAAYMTLLLNLEIVEQRQESVAAFEHHLKRARGYYEAGAKPRYDVTKAEVDLGNAQLSLVEAQAGIETAHAELLNAMGVSENISFAVSPVSWNVPERAENEAEEIALANRSDYKAAELKANAGKATLSSEARASSPSVSLTGGYSADGDDLFSLGKGWNAGVKVSVPIVDGGAQKARVEIARGQLDSLQASLEKMKQDILLEVRKVVTNLTKARERIRITELTVLQAEENRRLAEGRYETGVGDALEVTDALLSLTDAQLSAYQARYDLRIALIDLEKTTGKEFDFQSPQ